MEEQTQTQNWLDEEVAKLEKAKEEMSDLPEGLVLKTGTLTEVEVDFSKKFKEWHDEENATMKAIIPVIQNGVKKTWWLNKRNPVFADVIRRGKNGQTKFKISTTGEKKQTRYTIMEDVSSSSNSANKT